MKPFVDHKILKFVKLSKKYNPDYVIAFYCNLVRTPGGIKSRFKNKVVRFHYTDFTKYLGLTSFYQSVTGVKMTKYDRVSFVISISKFVVENLGMSNFPIGQVKFNMRILHQIFVKVFYMKPKNWGRDDEFYLYIMWVLFNNYALNGQVSSLNKCFITGIIRRDLYFSILLFS